MQVTKEEFYQRLLHAAETNPSLFSQFRLAAAKRSSEQLGVVMEADVSSSEPQALVVELPAATEDSPAHVLESSLEEDSPPAWQGTGSEHVAEEARLNMELLSTQTELRSVKESEREVIEALNLQQAQLAAAQATD